MKNKDKKTPKTNANEYILSSDAEAILYGLMLVLVSLIGLLSNGIVGEALTFMFSYLFGIFYVFVYLILIFLGLYLMITKTMFRLKIDLKILAFILLLLAFCIAASMGNNLTINNFFNIYQQQMDQVSSSIFVIDNTMDIFSYLGGGLVGFFLNGALNSTISEVGTSIVVFSFLILGLILLFKNLFVRFVKFIISFHKKRVQVRLEAKNKKKTLQELGERNVYLNETNITNNDNAVKENENKQEQEKIITPLRKEPSLIIEELNKDEADINLNNDFSFDEFNNFRKIGDIKKTKTDQTVTEIKDETINKQNDDLINNLINPLDKNEEDNFKPIIEEIVKPKEEIKNVEKINDDKIITDVQSKTIIEPTIIKINDSEEKNNITTTSSSSNENIVNDYSTYRYPPIMLLKDRINADESAKKVALAEERLRKINDCFHDLGIGANAISYTIGPSVTRFDIRVNSNVKTNVLCSVENDLAVRLGGNKTVRLETIVEGKDTSGIEVGNEICDTVSFKECLLSISSNTKDKLLFPLGKDISGNVLSCKLDEMPHLLVCGTTGSGKSVFIHNIIVSLIMRNRPDELKLMLIDPKRIEFMKYQDLPHLLCPVITSTEKGKVALMKLVDEMERRYDLFAEKGRGASNYKEYMETCEEFGYEKIPYIVMICDEYADFLADGDREVPKYIQRIAQKARACGIYMVVATQRPSAKVITGEIKANIPSRIALSVSSPLESRIIIDEQGAENLMGRGDLLAKLQTRKSMVRVQSAFIDSKEIYQVCEFIKQQAKFVCDPYFADLTLKSSSTINQVGDGTPLGMFRDYHSDPKFEEIKRYVIATGKCSATKIQTTFGIGFSHADGILDTLEQDGIIRKDKNRRVLCDKYLNEQNGDTGDE